MEKQLQQKASPVLGCLPHQQGPQPGEGSKGHRPSHASSGSSRKGDGQGSHTLPGFTQ